jgi:hypothetical protein
MLSDSHLMKALQGGGTQDAAAPDANIGEEIPGKETLHPAIAALA